MNIDLAALRALEREREIPYETILAAIETALLTAYRHTEGANPHARVEIDRKTGAATVYAQETDPDGGVVREYDDTPHDFGRIAAMTAKQVILQRLREATDEVHFGEYAGRDGDLVTGVVQAHEARTEKGIVTVDLGKLEAVLPAAEQVPGEVYEHGISLDAVADLSREISATLDAAEETGGEFSEREYVLEVSSPGVDRPLTQPRHWRRNIGRLVAVNAGEQQLTGRLVDADETGIVLEVGGVRHGWAYPDLGPGRVQIEFGRLDEAAGLDDDEEDEE